MMQGDRAGSRGRLWLILGVTGVMALAWIAGSGAPWASRVHVPSNESPDIVVGGRMGRDAGSKRPDDGERHRAEAQVLDASAASDMSDEAIPHHALKPVSGDRIPAALESSIARALRAIEDCQARYDQVRDYVCTFIKRERIDGHLGSPHVMLMKARTQPRSVYLKFRQPAAGREAIYIEGRHNGKVLAHDVGLGRLIAGTLHLDPTGARAMADCRHPITEAGIGPLLDTLEARWTAELDSSESRVDFRDVQEVGARPCRCITVTHTRQSPDFMFYRVHLYIDRELGLPIRFEAFDWPSSPGANPVLLEEYTYSDLKLNVGLGDIDFDVSNSAYAFGRF